MKRGKTDWPNIVVIVVLVLLGGILIAYSSSLNEYIGATSYDSEFDLRTTDSNSNSGEIIHIQDFTFYYDFTNNEGNISFYLNKENWSPRYIQISFPSAVKTDTIEIYTCEKANKTRIYPNISLDRINPTRITISKFETIFNDETFVIEFESDDLKPAGRFGFLNSEYNLLHSQDKNVNLILGNDYECRGTCISNLINIEETPNSFERDLQLKFKKEKADDYSAFNLHTVSRRILFWKSLLLGLGIAFLVAGLTFGLERGCKYIRGRDG